MKKAEFEWDHKKNQLNMEKHGVDFYDAQQAFLDKKRIRSQSWRETLLLFWENVRPRDDSAFYLA